MIETSIIPRSDCTIECSPVFYTIQSINTILSAKREVEVLHSLWYFQGTCCLCTLKSAVIAIIQVRITDLGNIEASADDGCQSASSTGSFDMGIGKQRL